MDFDIAIPYERPLNAMDAARKLRRRGKDWMCIAIGIRPWCDDVKHRDSVLMQVHRDEMAAEAFAA